MLDSRRVGFVGFPRRVPPSRAQNIARMLDFCWISRSLEHTFAYRRSSKTDGVQLSGSARSAKSLASPIIRSTYPVNDRIRRLRMGKTPGPLSLVRQPRHQAQGQDDDRPDQPRRIPQAAAEIPLQVLRHELHARAQERKSTSEVRRRCRPRGGSSLRPGTAVISIAGGPARAARWEFDRTRRAQQLGQ